MVVSRFHKWAQSGVGSPVETGRLTVLQVVVGVAEISCRRGPIGQSIFAVVVGKVRLGLSPPACRVDKVVDDARELLAP